MNSTRRNLVIFASGVTGACLLGGAPGVLAAGGKAAEESSACGSKFKLPAKIEGVQAIHFSPVGSTAKVARHLGNALQGGFANNATYAEVDLTAQELKEHHLGADTLCVVAVPVYSGRVPSRAVQALRKVQGGGAVCISVAVYGNRAFEDALLELNDVLIEQGFNVMASAAFIGEHSLAQEIATGRPDAADLAGLEAFAQELLQSFVAGSTCASPMVPGARPYKEVSATPVPILVSEACINCGQCAEACPVSAIDRHDFSKTDAAQCITCARCIRLCPVQARSFPAAYREKIHAFMSQFAARREPEKFV